MTTTSTSTDPVGAGLSSFLPPQRDSIPAELRARDQWVVWRSESKAGTNGDLTKVPYTTGGLRASSTNPSTWLSFDQAWALYEAGYDGIGYVFSANDPYTGIDLDAVVPQAEKDQIIAALDSYTETSPSGRGLHIIIRAGVLKSLKKDGVEVYSSARYFTVTGARVAGPAGPSPTIETRQAEVDALCAKRSPKPITVTKTTAPTRSMTDRAILDRIFAGARGEALRKLWEKDESEGDYALAARIHEEVGVDDADWIEQIMRASPFVRPKYDEPRGGETYLRLTINNMLAAAGHGDPENAPLRPPHELLADVERFLRRFVVFAAPAQVTALALWVLHTHTIAAADTTPYIAVTAPERESGKTRVFETLELIVAKPWRMSMPSDAVVYRKIDRDEPTLLLDEVDAIFNDKGHTYEGMRALLNAGYRRGNPVARCVGEGANLELKDFATFCAKAFAGIGNLPDTVADRSIPINLVRKLKSEKVERLRRASASRDAGPFHAALVRWGKSAVDALRDARPEPIPEISDRADEVWEPLLAIAELAGGEWPTRARAAARELYAVGATQQQNWGTELLAAVRVAFVRSGKDRLPTADLVEGVMKEMVVEKWIRAKNAGDQGRMASRGLAQGLKKWRVSPRTIRTERGTPKGYLLADLQPVFDRWLPPLPDNAEELDLMVGDHEPSRFDREGDDE